MYEIVLILIFDVCQVKISIQSYIQLYASFANFQPLGKEDSQVW